MTCRIFGGHNSQIITIHANHVLINLFRTYNDPKEICVVTEKKN